MFQDVEMVEPDRIFGLAQAYREDQRGEKVDLTLGIYRNAQGASIPFQSVLQVEEQFPEIEPNKVYLPMSGDPEFCREIEKVCFGGESDRIGAIQSVGGTGALRVIGDFLYFHGNRVIYLPDPTWANHSRIFATVGMDVRTYPYAEGEELDFDAMLASLKGMKKGEVVLFHASCHNPTGLDLSHRQWEEISKVMLDKGLIPFFDCAYQGFGDGLEEDVWSVRHFFQEGHEMFVAYSCSKAFGMYGERLGVAFAVSDHSKAIVSNMKRSIRANYSNPPRHGAMLVKSILMDDKLKALWEDELFGVRARLKAIRERLTDGLVERGVDAHFVRGEKGMFTRCGLTRDEAKRLREDFGIYVLDDGRMNLSGLNEKDIDYVIKAICEVTHSE